jgi:hypothetical protein
MDIGWKWLFAVDTEGRVYCSEGNFQDFHEETDPWRSHVVLARAALLYPEIDALEPIRTAEDPEYDWCRGTGDHTHSRQQCCCGGMGWIPAGVPQRSQYGGEPDPPLVERE